MKFEFIGCCFRVEVELFSKTLDWRRFAAARRRESPPLKRRLLRQLIKAERQMAAQSTNEYTG